MFQQTSYENSLFDSFFNITTDMTHLFMSNFFHFRNLSKILTRANSQPKCNLKYSLKQYDTLDCINLLTHYSFLS